MDAIVSKVKEWAVMPILGVPAAALVAVAGVAYYLLMGKNGRRKGGIFKR